VDADVIDRLVVDLDNRRFAVRKKAFDELEKIGGKAIPALKKAMTGQASEEIKKRAKELLDKLQGSALTPPQLQVARAIEVLERVGTKEARAVLERLAKGPAWALATTDSKAALERLK
jgi:HEAT repeat protein